MLLAVVLIAAGAVTVAVAAGHGDRGRVVVAARDVDAGQVISAADLRSARVDAEASLSLVAWDQRGMVVGRTAAVPVTAGEPLTGRLLGASRWPGVGYAVVAVTVKPGQAPPRLPVGQTVQVLFTASPNLDASARDSSTAAPAGVVAQVAGVTGDGSAGDGSRVVSLRAPVQTSQRIAAAPVVTLLATQPG